MRACLGVSVRACLGVCVRESVSGVAVFEKCVHGVGTDDPAMNLHLCVCQQKSMQVR